jgi:hypothetical protein
MWTIVTPSAASSTTSTAAVVIVSPALPGTPPKLWRGTTLVRAERAAVGVGSLIAIGTKLRLR